MKVFFRKFCPRKWYVFVLQNRLSQGENYLVDKVGHLADKVLR